jgi:membrane protein CcdC involved in cytochrome C biogenesis
MLYAMALACAPAMVSTTFQFFLPTQNGRIARSLAYSHMMISLLIHRIFLSSSFSESVVNADVS